MLEIITENNLTADEKKTLNEFNELYTKWNDSIINEYTFIEMQAKLLRLQQFIINSIKKNNGFLQICKSDPEIKLRYIENEENIINVIMPQDDTTILVNIENEVMELREMLLNCVGLYSTFFEQSDFEELGGSYSRIIENTDKLEEQQRILYEHGDIECMYE